VRGLLQPGEGFEGVGAGFGDGEESLEGAGVEDVGQARRKAAKDELALSTLDLVAEIDHEAEDGAASVIDAAEVQKPKAVGLVGEGMEQRGVEVVELHGIQGCGECQLDDVHRGGVNDAKEI